MGLEIRQTCNKGSKAEAIGAKGKRYRDAGALKNSLLPSSLASERASLSE